MIALDIIQQYLLLDILTEQLVGVLQIVHLRELQQMRFHTGNGLYERFPQLNVVIE